MAFNDESGQKNITGGDHSINAIGENVSIAINIESEHSKTLEKLKLLPDSKLKEVCQRLRKEFGYLFIDYEGLSVVGRDEFLLKIIYALEKYSEGMLHLKSSIETKETSYSSNISFHFSDEEETDAPVLLNEFQRQIYRVFDDLNISTLADYQRLSDEERSYLDGDILNNMLGLNGENQELINHDHINTLFDDVQVSSRSDTQLSILHRKTAVYSEHSIVGIDAIRYYGKEAGFERKATGFLEEDVISLLIRNRPLITTGRMSVVPRFVKMVQGNGNESAIFNVRNLEALDVNLNDREVGKFFLSRGKMLRNSGTLVINSPGSSGLDLESILEIISVKYPTQYEFFQAELKKTISTINHEDSTVALKQSIAALNAGIMELDVKYGLANIASKSQDKTKKSHAMAIRLYSAKSEVSHFLKDAFSFLGDKDLVSFVPGDKSIPNEILASPYFIPWFIRHNS